MTKESKNKTIYLIDGSAYIYRAYHAVRSLSNSKGFPTNAVFGFTRMLLKLIREKEPEYIVMFFDAKGPTFRHEIYSEYKANRPPMPDDLKVQIKPIKDITLGFNLRIIQKNGFEADDLIGTISQKAQEAGFRVVMVTGDKDFIQLVTDKAVIWDPMKDKTIDVQSIQEEYKIQPHVFRDILGLAGDTADNIPGVPGIGIKTAVSLMQKFGTIESLYQQIDTITKKKQQQNLAEYKDRAFLSRRLAAIETNAPVEFKEHDFIYTSPDNDRLAQLFKQFEFRQLQQDLPGKSDLSKKNYNAVFKEHELESLISRLESSNLFALDTETTSVNSMTARLIGLSFSTQPDEAFYIPCGHDYPDAPSQLDLKYVLNLLRPVLENKDIKKIGQNIKYDLMMLARYNINLRGVVFDTMLASYLINPSKRGHSLDQIALDFLGHKTITYEDVAGKGKKNEGFNTVAIDKAIPYACEDADITLSAYNVLKPMLEDAGLADLMENVEVPLISVLMQMEMKGIHVDKNRLRSLSGKIEQQLKTLETSIYEIAGQKFNIRSSQQLGDILFEKLKLPVQKKTKKKTGYSTDVDVLTTLAKKHELPAVILEHRTLSKIKSTYSDALSNLVNPETGRIHTSFNQTVTATGRLSSSNPNLQNIPIKTEEGKEIRRAFVPKPGCHILAADYSQIELRILAHYSEDPILIKAFMEDEDIHTRTASEIFQVFPAMIDPQLRRQAKEINFGIIYGMSPFGLSKSLGISRKMATTYIDNYFSRYSRVKKFIRETITLARETKKTSTLLGRIRVLPDINSTNQNVRKFAERTAVNTPIQGSAADLIKIAMINLDKKLAQQNLESAMLLSVHDEIILEVPSDELETVTQLVTQIMENVWELKVPLKVNVSFGENWAQAH
jgi:DNA polymerase I